MRLTTALLLCLLISALMVGAVTVNLDKTDYSPGEIVRISIADCTGSSLAKVYNSNNDLVDIKAGSDAWSTSYNTASDASKGKYLLTASCENGKLDQNFCVGAPGCVAVAGPAPSGGTRSCSSGYRLEGRKCVRITTSTATTTTSGTSTGGTGGGGTGGGGSRPSDTIPTASSPSQPVSQAASQQITPQTAPVSTRPGIEQFLPPVLQQPTQALARASGLPLSTVVIGLMVIAGLVIAGVGVWLHKKHQAGELLPLPQKQTQK